MATRLYTFFTAIFLLLLGACAFIPALNGGPRPTQVGDTHVLLGYTQLFNQLPMNKLLAGILIGFGVSGLLTFRRRASARLWCQILFVTSLVLMAIGFSPMPLASVFGLLPLYGWTCSIFLVLVLATPYFAFFDGGLPPSAKDAVFRQE